MVGRVSKWRLATDAHALKDLWEKTVKSLCAAQILVRMMANALYWEIIITVNVANIILENIAKSSIRVAPTHVSTGLSASSVSRAAVTPTTASLANVHEVSMATCVK